MRTNVFHRYVAVVAISAASMAPQPSLAQSTSPSLQAPSSGIHISTVSASLTPVAVPSRAVFELSRQFTDPADLQPYGVVDQNNVRQSRYTNPMHCNTAGLLTPLQMEAAWQACSDRFFNVDHSG